MVFKIIALNKERFFTAVTLQALSCVSVNAQWFILRGYVHYRL